MLLIAEGLLFLILYFMIAESEKVNMYKEAGKTIHKYRHKIG